MKVGIVESRKLNPKLGLKAVTYLCPTLYLDRKIALCRRRLYLGKLRLRELKELRKQALKNWEEK